MYGRSTVFRGERAGVNSKNGPIVVGSRREGSGAVLFFTTFIYKSEIRTFIYESKINKRIYKSKMYDRGTNIPKYSRVRSSIEKSFARS